MGRTYDEWIKTQDQALVAKTRAGDESNKPLLNQINWIWIALPTLIGFGWTWLNGYILKRKLGQ